MEKGVAMHPTLTLLLDKCQFGEFSVACLVGIYAECHGLIWKSMALPVALALPVYLC